MRPAFPALVAVGSIAAYWRFRHHHIRWGATDDEIRRSMPGDDLVARPHIVTNRAVTINAAPGDVWPWLVQMGDAPRGGYYSYAPVERILGMNIENANEILPQFQELRIGDALDAGGNMRVRAIEPGASLVLGPPELPQFDSTWAMALYPQPDGRTRFVSRVRARYKKWTLANIITLMILDVGQLVMERKWLLGVKQRAERLARAKAIPAV